MAITKTDFINYTRCPRYMALAEIKKERLDADVFYDDYKKAEKEEQIQELLGSMYDLNDNEEEIDLVDKVNRQLEAMLKYYNQVEIEAGRIVKDMFPGKTVYAEETHNQECFDFNHDGIKYMCYVDVYNECNDKINIIEVKATTSKKYVELLGNYPKGEKFSIFEKINNIHYLKEELEDYDIEAEMPIEKYSDLRSKLFDRFGIGGYIYDLAVQRFIIEGEYEECNNEEKLKDIKYYLAVLNCDYIFDGTYVDGKAVYNKDENGNEIVTFFDMTKITEEYQNIIKNDALQLEKNIREMNPLKCPLGKWCGYKKQNCCKFFDPICGAHIPKKNSSLSYIHNGFGFKDLNGNRIKGLDLINEGYINMLDIPSEWITNEAHNIQRDSLMFDTVYLDKEKLSIGLKQLEYPIYHLDFETFPCPMPRYKGEWPYIQSPFEFSLHIEHAPGICDKDKDNYIFLAKSHEDEREELVKKLVEWINPDKGTLFAQNVAFEKGRIKELAKIFPDYRVPLLKMNERAFDLLWLVNTKSSLYEELGFDKTRAKLFNFYDKRLSGSFSIKKTLPVFSDLSYDNLVVKNGTEAIVEYANYPYMSKEEFELKYKALEIYCKQDTWAMVVILDELRKLVK